MRITVAASMLAVGLFVACAGEPMPPDAELEKVAIESDGNRVAILDGAGYVYNREAKKWEFYKRLWEKDWFEKNYAVDGDRVFRISDDGSKVEVSRRFKSGFEDAATIKDLIGLKHGWTAFTVQSPKALDVSDYVKLRNRILKEGAPFLDNVVEPSTAKAHGGKTALRTFSVASTKEMVCAKSSLQSELIHFRKGDDFWYSAWYFIEDRVPFTLMDLESTWIEGHSGIRITTSGKGLGFELKHPPKPHYRPTNPTPIPVGKWFRVVAHVKLDEKDGVCELWQDGVKVCEGKGQTLPFAEAVYNSLEVGISATNVESTTWVDDVEVSDEDLK
ncbi:MAG: heparin lyase I family protein [Planctomycetota bacterium]